MEGITFSSYDSCKILNITISRITMVSLDVKIVNRFSSSPSCSSCFGQCIIVSNFG